MLGDSCGSGHSRLTLLADSSQQLLDLSDRTARVETLGARLGAIHDGVTSVKEYHSNGRSKYSFSFSSFVSYFYKSTFFSKYLSLSLL